jgi:rubrerythrin
MAGYEKDILTAQRIETTEHLIYTRLAAITKGKTNKRIPEHIAADEKTHADFWRQITGVQAKPHRLNTYPGCPGGGDVTA